MLSRAEVEQLLALQSRAYELLMWLSDEATRDPHVLSPEAVAALQEPGTAARWLQEQQSRIPERLMPDEPAGSFANLFSSFFSTSFHVKHLGLRGRLVDSRVALGAPRESAAGAGVERCQALALKHLAASAKVPITEEEARRLVRRSHLREPSLLWTYVWELDRRARHKGKGPVVHRIWRTIPREAKNPLKGEQIWEAREQLLAAVRDYCATQAP